MLGVLANNRMYVRTVCVDTHSIHCGCYCGGMCADTNTFSSERCSHVSCACLPQ